MSVTVAQLDDFPETQAAFLLAACCGSSRWVASMVARRPFRTRAAVLAAADQMARELQPADWIEAFSHHPRIGERQSSVAVSTMARDWSADEQRVASDTDDRTRLELADSSAKYEQRFGFPFIVCASGRSAEELLAVLEERLGSSSDAELAIAAKEQQLITRQRLARLVRGTEER